MEISLPSDINWSPNSSKKNIIPSFKKLSLACFMSAFVFLAGMVPGSSFGQVTITEPTLTVSACGDFPTAEGTLGNIIISETSEADIVSFGTLVLKAPSNFEFTSAGSGTSTNNGNVTTVTTDLTDATTITITIAGSNLPLPLLDKITLSGIKVIGRAAGSGAITRDALDPGSAVILGDNEGTVHATLTSELNPTPTITGTPTVCVGATTQLIGSGTPATTNAWGSSKTSVATVSALGVVTGVAAGTSLITYTNDNGCQETITVTVNAAPTITPPVSATSVCSSTSAQTTPLTYTATGSPLTYSITWNAAATSEGFAALTNAALSGSPIDISVPAGAAAGTYTGTISVANAGGCVSTAKTFTVTVAAKPSITPAATAGDVCASTSAPTTPLTYTATGLPVTYSITWNTAATSEGFAAVADAALPGSPIDISVPTGAAAGTYTGTITVANAGGCASTAKTFTVTVNGKPAVNTPSSTLCVGSLMTLSPTIGGTWTSSNNSFATVTNAGAVTGVAAGSVTFTFTNTSTGCSNTTSSVTVSAAPTTSISGTSAICSEGSTTLNSNATARSGTISSYQWKLGGTNITGATGATYSASSAGNYTVVVTNSNGCSTTSASFAVTTNASPTTSITGTATICSGSSTTLNSNATAGSGTISSYQWKLNGTNISGATGATYSASSAGSYTVVVTNGNNCSTTSASFAVTTNGSPTTSITGTATICSGSSTALNSNATAGSGTISSYQWKLGGTTISGATGATYSASSAGSYTVVVTNSNGCSTTSAPFAVTTNASPTTSITGTATICSGGSTTLNSNATAGSGTISSYQWKLNGTDISGATNATYSASSAGSYTVAVTNSNGCSTTSAPYTVTTNTSPTTSITGTATICSGSSTTLNSNATAGSGTISSYQWKLGGTDISGATNATYSASSAGSYTVVVTNSNTCSTTSAPFAVTVNPLPTQFNITGNNLYCTGGSGSTLGLSGSETGVSYQLYKNNQTSGSPVPGTGSPISFTQQPQGTYTVVATRGSSCTTNMPGSISVAPNASPTAVAGAIPNTVCEIGNVQLQAYTDTTNGRMIDYSLSNITYNYITPTTSTTIPSWQNGTDDGYATIPLPFSFTFFNQQYNTNSNIYVSTNGFVSFTSLATGNSTSAQKFPNSAPSNNLIALAMSDLIKSTGSARYFTTGTAPNRIFVIEYNDFRFSRNNAQQPSSVNGQIQLYENKNIIEVHVNSVSYQVQGNGLKVPSTLGIENSDGTQGNSPTGKSNSTWEAAGVAYRWVPIASYSWSPSTFLNNTNISNPVATGVNTGTTYKVTITDVIGCSTTSGPLTINVNKKSSDPTSATSSVSTICSGGSAILTLSGGGNGTGETIKWYSGSCGGTLVGLGNGIQVSPTVTTTYFGRYENGAPCNFTTGCKSVTINVNPRPTATISGTTPICNGSSTNISVSLTGTGPWTSTISDGTTTYNFTNIATSPYVLSISPTSTKTYTVTSLSDSKCTAIASDINTTSATITVNPLPAAYIVTGGGGYCPGGNGVPVDLSNSQTGVSYQLFIGATAVGTPKTGTTGSAISFGLQTAAGTYTVVAKNNSTLCTQNMTGAATVIVNPTPSPTISANGSTASCTGAVTLRSDSATGNQWYRDGQAITLLGTSQNYIATIAGSYTVTVTNSSGCSGTSQPVVVSFIINSWIAAADSSWNNPLNWCSGKVPTDLTDATIPSNAVRFPVLLADAQVRSLEIQPGAAVNLKDKTLTINGSLTGTGKFIGSDASGLTLNGTSSPVTLYFDQTTDAGTNVLGGLTITKPVTVSLNDKLYITGTLAPNGSTLNTNDHLTLRSTSIANTARVAPVSGTINGDVTVERFIPARRSFRFISPSVTTTTSIKTNWMEGQVNPGVYVSKDDKKGYGTNITGNDPTSNGFDPTITNNPSIFTFDRLDQKWVAVPNTRGTLSAGEPYRLMVRGGRSTKMWQADNNPDSSNTILRATGKLTTGSYFPVLSTKDTGYTFIGNPYASPVDFQKMLANSTNIKHIYYAYDPLVARRGSYVIYDADNNSNSIPGKSKVDNNLQSGQAVFVQNTNRSSAIAFKEEYKSTGNTNVFRNPTKLTKLSLQLLLNQDEGLQNTADGVVAFFDNNYSAAIGDEDSYKFTNLDENLAINRRGTALSIEGRPSVTADDTIQLQMWQFRQKNYYLRLSASNFSPEVTAFVKDAYLHKETPVDLSTVTLYPFTIDTAQPASAAKERFSIVFKAGTTLPVMLTNVKAYQSDEGVEVNWTAQAETNTEGYEVEKSVNGQQFKKVTAIPAKGNNGVDQNYSWTDAAAGTGSNFYRIKVIEKSGAVKYSNVAKVNIAEGQGTLTISPNPIKGNVITLRLKNMEKGRYSAVLYNTLGQKLYSSTIEHTSRSGIYTISLGRIISKGTYTLHISKGGTAMNERVIVE